MLIIEETGENEGKSENDDKEAINMGGRGRQVDQMACLIKAQERLPEEGGCWKGL